MSAINNKIDVPHSELTLSSPVFLSVEDDPVNTINPTYASFNVDSSYNRGFFHINFTNPNLAGAARGEDSSQRAKL